MRKHVAIIGAGLAGAILAQRLHDTGHSVTVLEKSRGTGGRMASCRLDNHSADLGAPWFVPSNPLFREWLQQQKLQQWSPVIHDFSGHPVTSEPIWLSAPRQSALTRELLKHARLVTETKVDSVWPEVENGHRRIVVRSELNQVIGYFDKVIITAPAVQAAPLLEAIPRFSATASSALTKACWVSLIKTGLTGLPADIYCGEHPVLHRCIRDNSKPQRKANGEIWVLEANSEWSNQHIDTAPEQIHKLLLSSFEKAVATQLESHYHRTHRWLLARHSSNTSQTHLWDPDTGIGACGDWLAHCGLEGSWISANALAEQIIETATATAE